MASIHELPSILLSRLKLLPPFAIGIAVVASGLIYLYSGDQKIEVKTGSLFIRLAPSAKEVACEFANFVFYDSYSFHSVKNDGKRTHLLTTNPKGLVEARLISISVDKKASSSINKQESMELRIDLPKQWPPPLLINLFIDGEEIPSNELISYISDTNYEIRSRRSIREQLSIVITKYNDVVADYALAIAFAFLVYVFARWFKLVFSQYRLNHANNPRELVNERYSTDSNGGSRNREIAGLIEERWYDEERFALIIQVLGPTLGFLFTITALISALAPLAGSDPEIAGFLNAIRVALVSTFLGLVSKTLGAFVQRTNENVFLLECEAIRSPAEEGSQ